MTFPTDPLVVLIHGAGHDRRIWWAVTLGLSRLDWQVSAPDLPGHGADERAPGLTRLVVERGHIEPHHPGGDPQQGRADEQQDDGHQEPGATAHRVSPTCRSVSAAETARRTAIALFRHSASSEAATESATVSSSTCTRPAAPACRTSCSSA